MSLSTELSDILMTVVLQRVLLLSRNGAAVHPLLCICLKKTQLLSGLVYLFV